MRATSAAAAAPNSKTIGGAGTGVGGPPDEPGGPPELLDELDDELPDAPLLPPVLLVLDDPFDDQPPVDDQPWLDEP